MTDSVETKPVYQSKIIWSALALQMCVMLQKDWTSLQGLMPSNVYEAGTMLLPLVIVVLRTYFSGTQLTVLPK